MAKTPQDRQNGQRVTIVTVTYNSSGVLPAMLASVPAGTPVVIVDNASDDAAATEALARAHGAALVLSPKNDGFGLACNHGAALAGTEFILFLNPDTRLCPDTLDRLVAAADCHPRVSAMNPRILRDDGSTRFKHKSNLLPSAEWLAPVCPTGDCEMPVLSGAAFFVRRADFAAVGGFDPALFLFYEDDDLSCRLRAERGPLMFIHDAVVHHTGGDSSGSSRRIAVLKAWHLGHSRVYARRKHGRPFARSRTIKVALVRLGRSALKLSAAGIARDWAFLGGVLNACFGGDSRSRMP